MRSFLQLPVLALVICTSLTTSAHEFDWPGIVFKDTNNFIVVKAFEHPLPKQYFLLNKTDAWRQWRLSVKEDITDPEVVKTLRTDEHHSYQWYIFRNPVLDTLVPMGERNYLFTESQKLTPVSIKPDPGSYQLIDTSAEVSKGFYFSLTQPIFSINHEFAYIDLNILLKQQPEPGEEEIPYSDFYASVLLVYRYSKEKGWVKFFQSNHLFL